MSNTLITPSEFTGHQTDFTKLQNRDSLQMRDSTKYTMLYNAFKNFQKACESGDEDLYHSSKDEFLRLIIICIYQGDVQHQRGCEWAMQAILFPVKFDSAPVAEEVVEEDHE